MRGRLLAIAGMLYLMWTAALAAAPDGDLSFERRRWTLADGAPSQSFNLQQTADGLLWFSSPSGLYSFDGVKFRQESEVYGHKLRSPNTISLHARRDGSLAIGYAFGGLSIFSRQGARHYTAGVDFPLGSTRAIAAAPDGTWYAGTTTGVVRLEHGQWVAVPGSTALSSMVDNICFDAEGALWVQSAEELLVLRPGTRQLVYAMKSPGRDHISLFAGHLHVKLPGGAIARLRSNGERQVLRIDNVNAYDAVTDGPNGVVIALRNDGFARMAQRADGRWYETEFYPPVAGSSAGAGSPGAGISLLLDREGNLWSTTLEGVEKMRLHRFQQFRRQDDSWLARRGLGDEMWLGGRLKPMLRMRADGTSQVSGVTAPTALLRLGDDHVWLGDTGGLWEYRNGGVRRWAFPPQVGKHFDVQTLALDADGALLVSIVRHGLWRLENGVWRRDPRLQDQKDPTPINMLRDSRGQTWVGLTNSRLAVLGPRAATWLPATAGLRIGNILSLADIGGRLLVGGDMGVAWVDGARALPMQFQHNGQVQLVTGLLLDGQGRLWVHCNHGLLVVSAAALQQFWQAPDRPLAAELFNFEDGVGGTASPTRPLPTLAMDGSGRVYYATTSQAGWVDPARIRRNPRAPDVIIQSVQAGASEYPAADGLLLPEYTTAVDIAFTATALSIPERASLKYRLQGVDSDWQEVRLERRAHYTNLAPGRYRFQVIAANEDGVWNQHGATLQFEIKPALWQTNWFRVLLALLLVLLMAALYRWRMLTVRRRAEDRAAALIEATLQERSRIARSLHDNLLQAVQALLLRFHTLQGRVQQEPDLQERLDQVLLHAEQLVESTRDEVVALRSDPLRDDLFVALRKAVAGTLPAAERLLAFSIAGAARPLREEIAGELYYVLREAVWNSARHAQASRIGVELRFGEAALEASVADDGVGLRDDCPPAAGGHWGITGMRERVQRIGGAIEIGAGATGGVIVRVTIPAALAYA